MSATIASHLDVAEGTAHRSAMAKQQNPGPADRSSTAPEDSAATKPPVQRRRGVGVHLGLEEAARDLLRKAGEGLVEPATIARVVGGPTPDGWGPLMQPLRLALVKLAHDGSIIIYRKGQPADPDTFRGLYRIGRGPAFDAWEI